MKLKIELPSHAAEALRRMYETGELEAIGIAGPEKQHTKDDSEAAILSRYAPHTIHLGKVADYIPDNGLLVIQFTEKITGLYPATIGRKDAHFTTAEGKTFHTEEPVLAKIKDLNTHLEDYYSFNLEGIDKTPPKDCAPSSN